MAPPQLSNYERVLHDDFNGPFQRYDGETGIWSTRQPFDFIKDNGPASVFLDGTQRDKNGKLIGIDPFSTKNGALHIEAGILNNKEKNQVKDVLRANGETQNMDKLEYYTGQINTHDSLDLTYGYFEAEVKLPEGRGHWPAFYLIASTDGWPPEITIFEAYGSSIHREGGHKKDHVFNNGIHFDTIGADGKRDQNINVTNPYELDENGNPVEAGRRDRFGLEIGHFKSENKATDLIPGADTYNDFYTYAVEWTPDEIVFYFGKDRDSLIETYRGPVPEDIHSPMNLILRSHVSSSWGWNPVEGYEDETFAKSNALQIDSVSVYAMKPDKTLDNFQRDANIVDKEGVHDATLVGTDGHDKFVPHAGLDVIDMRGAGKDVVFIGVGNGNDIIDGFDRSDTVVIEGWHLESAQAALDRLTQVGQDVWLTNGAYPKDPQSIVFRNTTINKFSEDSFEIRASETPNIWGELTIDGTRLRDDNNDGIVRANKDGSRMADGSNVDGTVRMFGSNEGDEFNVFRPHTKVIEKPNGGMDTVFASKSFSLPDHVERLVGRPDSGKYALEGNSLNNGIVGSGGDDTITGNDGNDVIDLTRGGADRVIFNAGDDHDVIAGFSANDRLILRDLVFGSNADFQDRLTVRGEDVMLDLGRGNSITFRDTERSTVVNNVEYETGNSNLRAPDGGDPFYRPSVSSLKNDGDGGGSVGGSGGGDNGGSGGGNNGGSGGGNNGGSGGGNNGGSGESPGTPSNPGESLFLQGDTGKDFLKGGQGDDIIVSHGNDDTLVGGAGDDLLVGGAGDDRLVGSKGDDRMVGGGGDNVYVGGEGRDTFVAKHGTYTIKDFELGRDAIETNSGVGIDEIFAVGNNTRVLFTDPTDITFVGLSVAEVESLF